MRCDELLKILAVPEPIPGKLRAVLRDVFTELGDLSARKMAEVLNARGVPTPEGGKWYATQVIRVRKRQ
ncbi:MAG: recombinase family protein [Xanthobacteraceae bacterium]